MNPDDLQKPVQNDDPKAGHWPAPLCSVWHLLVCVVCLEENFHEPWAEQRKQDLCTGHEEWEQVVVALWSYVFFVTAAMETQSLGLYRLDGRRLVGQVAAHASLGFPLSLLQGAVACCSNSTGRKQKSKLKNSYLLQHHSKGCQSCLCNCTAFRTGSLQPFCFLLWDDSSWWSSTFSLMKWFVNRKVVCCAQSFDDTTPIPSCTTKILDFHIVYSAMPNGVPFQGGQVPYLLTWEFSCLDVADSLSSSSASSCFSQALGLHWVCSALVAQAKQRSSLQEHNCYPSAFSMPQIPTSICTKQTFWKQRQCPMFDLTQVKH